MSFRSDVQTWYKGELLKMTDLCYEFGVIDDTKDLLSTLNKNADAMMHAEVVNTLLKNEEAIVAHINAVDTEVAMRLTDVIQPLLRMHRTFAYGMVEMIDRGELVEAKKTEEE